MSNTSTGNRSSDDSDGDVFNDIGNCLKMMHELKFFLATAPVNWQKHQIIRRYYLNGTHGFVSCVFWNNLFYITGTDIVKTCLYKMECFGRKVINLKKFEEGVFSDLRNLKCGVDAILEQPKSDFLKLLFKNLCLKTKKKQKVFFWFNVPHDKLFMDALERDLKRERANHTPTTLPVAEPALSFNFNFDKDEPLESHFTNFFNNLDKSLRVPKVQALQQTITSESTEKDSQQNTDDEESDIEDFPLDYFPVSVEYPTQELQVDPIEMNNPQVVIASDRKPELSTRITPHVLTNREYYEMKGYDPVASLNSSSSLHEMAEPSYTQRTFFNPQQSQQLAYNSEDMIMPSTSVHEYFMQPEEFPPYPFPPSSAIPVNMIETDPNVQLPLNWSYYPPQTIQRPPTATSATIRPFTPGFFTAFTPTAPFGAPLLSPWADSSPQYMRSTTSKTFKHRKNGNKVSKPQHVNARSNSLTQKLKQNTTRQDNDESIDATNDAKESFNKIMSSR
ncbi:hypothetical protein KAFR_0D04820 [Kazachstania africana CBS 2517]|uniref:STE12 n=1 Tax=Kazachstania africana (strain ATCC 22294 / BCRC 22015 / CBS 2517 / CECT 1963 / NBRC 1671 / NRRL Y-8276) TaxID=1071382 RepID=H2AUS9_KAZAF|nr:hypothetical protein KAFR_0D04820 [Kazachstania africana CBS 2517]CCF58129.1 hypothetical protein KAFR_0D04820 [Kazachstania africana CBS 2517]